MALDKQFILEVGAQLDEASFEKDIKKVINALENDKSITTVMFKGDIDDKQVLKNIDKLTKEIQKRFGNIGFGKMDLNLDGITNLQRRIGMLKNDLKNSGLDQATSDFKAMAKTIAEVEREYDKLLSGDNDINVEDLKNKLNSVEVQYDDLIGAQKRFRQEQTESKGALQAYARELEKLNKIQLDLHKEESRVKSNKVLLDTAESRKYREELKKSINLQQQNVNQTRKVAEATAGADAATKVFAQSQQKLNTAMAGVNATGKNQLGFLESVKLGFKDAFARITNYTLAYNTITLAMQKMRESVDTIVELDQKMVDLQIVTGNTRKEVHSMMQEYNEMAKSMGRTTSDVAESANEFLRMGYNAQESNELIKQSLTLSTLGMIENAEATDYLISAIKGYGMEVSEVSKIIDMATELDMKYSVSSGYILEAMSRTAASAKMAGSEMSKLMATIAIVGETTKKSPEVVGEAMKTMYARFGNVKINKFEDADNPDEVEGINDIERVLSKMGIAIRESGGAWRDYDEVMQEVGERFQEMTDYEKNAVATAMFGTRQRENGIVILSNWNKILEANELAMNASGTSAERMEAYEKSLQAAIERLKASWESFLLSLGDNTMIIKAVNALSELVGILSDPIVQNIIIGGLLVKGIQKLSNGFGGFSTKINAVGNAITKLLSKAKSMTVIKSIYDNTFDSFNHGYMEYVKGANNSYMATNGLSKAMQSGAKSASLFSSSIAKLSIGIAVAYGVVSLLDWINGAYERNKEKLQQVNSEYEESTNKLSEVEGNLKQVGSKIDELNSKDTLTIVEQEELEKLKKENAELEKQLALYKGINEEKSKEKTKQAVETFESDMHKRNEFAITEDISWAPGKTYQKGVNEEEYIQSEFERLKELQKTREEYFNRYLAGDWKNYGTIEAYDKMIDDIKQYLISKSDEFDDLYGDLEYIENPTQEWQKKNNEIVSYVKDFKDKILKITNPDEYIKINVNSIISEYSDAIKTLEDYKEVNEDVLKQDQYSDMVSEFEALGYTISDIIKELGYGSEKVKDNKENIKQYTEEMKSAVAGVSDFVDEMSSIDDIISNLESGGALNADDIQTLADKYPELTDELYEYLTGQKSEAEIIKSIKAMREKSMSDYIDDLQEAYKKTVKYRSKIYTDNKTMFNNLGLEYDENKNKFIISNMKMAEAAIKYAGVSQEAWMNAVNDFLTLPWMSDETNSNGEDSMYIGDNGDLYVHRHNFENTGKSAEINMGKQGAAIVKDAQETQAEFEKERKEIEEEIKRLEKESGGSSTDKYKETFEKWYNDLKHQLAMDEITQEEYFNKLEEKNNSYFKGRVKYEEEYKKYLEEVYKGRKTLWKEAYEDELSELERNYERKIISEEDYLQQRKNLADKYFKDNPAYEEEYEKASDELWKLEKDSHIKNYEDEIEALEKKNERKLISDKEYLEEYKRLTDQYYKDNPLYKDEYGEAQDVIYDLGIDQMRSEYETWISMHERYIEDMDYYNRWSLQQKLQYIATEKQAMIELYGENEELAEEFYENLKNMDKNIYDVSGQIAQQNLDVHDSYLEYVNDIIDDKIKLLEEEREKLNETNKEREQAIKLAELEKKLAEAKRNKVLIYREGQGFVYEQDETKVNEAQKEIDDYMMEREKEKRLEAIEKEIEGWEDYREEWNNTVEAYEREQTRLTALMYDGYASEKEILEKRTDLIVEYADSYAKAAQKVKEYNEMINSNRYDWEYDLDKEKFETEKKEDLYERPSNTKIKEIQRQIGNSGNTYAILPDGTLKKVNLNSDNKVTDSLDVGSIVVNSAGAWQVTGGKPGAYTSNAIDLNSSVSASKNPTSGGNSGGGGSFSNTPAGGSYGGTSDGMSAADKAAISAAGDRYNEAKANGDTAGMEKAHADAEAIRNKYGYSGGDDGSQKIPTSGGSSGGGSKNNNKNTSSASSTASKVVSTVSSVISSIVSSLTKHADGTMGTPSDELSIVGEEGRELKLLPKGTGVIPNPATETLLKFANNPASFIKALDATNVSSLQGENHTEIFEINGVSVNANNADEFINSLRSLKNKAIQKTSKRN